MHTQTKKGSQVQGILALLFLLLTTSIGFIPVFLIGIIKLLPFNWLKNRCTLLIDAIVTFWCTANNAYINRLQRVKWEISGDRDINKNNWHLVIANHQSWLDIVILQRLFNKKIPVLKFFVKDQLKWIPLLGFAWWAMGCPFMKRYSKEYLAKKPHKQGKDLQATHKAINKFKQTPASIMNFVEGTRFTDSKKHHSNSPYKHLLKPKAGGIGYIISTMNQHINHLLDVTIIYPQRQMSLWDFLCKRMQIIKIHIRQIPIPSEFNSEALAYNQEIQVRFRNWLNQQWAEKDKIIALMKGETTLQLSN